MTSILRHPMFAAVIVGTLIGCAVGCRPGSVQVTPAGSGARDTKPSGETKTSGSAPGHFESNPWAGAATQVIFSSAEIHGSLPTRVEGIAFLPVRARTTEAYRIRMSEPLELSNFSGIQTHGAAVRFLVPRGDGSTELHELNISTLAFRNLGPLGARRWPETLPNAPTSVISVVGEPRQGTSALRLRLPTGERTLSLGVPASMTRWVCPVVSGDWVYYADQVNSAYVIARLNLRDPDSLPEVFSAPRSDDIGYLCPELGGETGGAK